MFWKRSGQQWRSWSGRSSSRAARSSRAPCSSPAVRRGHRGPRSWCADSDRPGVTCETTHSGSSRGPVGYFTAGGWVSSHSRSKYVRVGRFPGPSGASRSGRAFSGSEWGFQVRWGVFWVRVGRFPGPPRRLEPATARSDLAERALPEPDARPRPATSPRRPTASPARIPAAQRPLSGSRSNVDRGARDYAASR